MVKYLGFVKVFNLLQEDYTDERIEEIEKVINGSFISSVDHLFQPTPDMIYSFPPDPSVKDPKIPVVVDIQLFNLTYTSYTERDEMTNLIRANLLFVFPRRGDVVVIVLGPVLISFSPRN